MEAAVLESPDFRDDFLASNLYPFSAFHLFTREAMTKLPIRSKLFWYN